VSTSLHAGLAPFKAEDGKFYTSILYGNGPGYKEGDRPNVTESESGECSRAAGQGSGSGGNS
jgi:hypothetical protein